MDEVEFYVIEPAEGGFIARSTCGGIVTQADSLDELRRNVREAAACHCEPGPARIRLRFVRVLREEVLEPLEP